MLDKKAEAFDASCRCYPRHGTNERCATLVSTAHQDIVVLFQLGIPYLLLHFVVAMIHIHEEVLPSDPLSDFVGVPPGSLADGYDHDLDEGRRCNANQDTW